MEEAPSDLSDLGAVAVLADCGLRSHGASHGAARRSGCPEFMVDGEIGMPIATVKLIEGFFPPMQKQEMIRKITDATVEVGGGR